MSDFKIFRELREHWNRSSTPAKCVLLLSAFITTGSFASLSDIVFHWKGAVLTAIEFYGVWVTGTLRRILSFFGLSISPIKADFMILACLVITSNFRAIDWPSSKSVAEFLDPWEIKIDVLNSWSSRLRRKFYPLWGVQGFSIAFAVSIMFLVFLTTNYVSWLFGFLAIYYFVVLWWMINQANSKIRKSSTLSRFGKTFESISWWTLSKVKEEVMESRQEHYFPHEDSSSDVYPKKILIWLFLYLEVKKGQVYNYILVPVIAVTVLFVLSAFYSGLTRSS